MPQRVYIEDPFVDAGHERARQLLFCTCSLQVGIALAAQAGDGEYVLERGTDVALVDQVALSGVAREGVHSSAGLSSVPGGILAFDRVH